jgi:hypothetical protein
MLAVLVAAANLFAQAFAGAWTCHSDMPATSDHAAHSVTTEWSIESAPGDKWAIVKWGAQDGSANGGIAYVGYVPSENDWAYQDFHYDGSFGVLTSAGPDKDNMWTWAGGAYYTQTGILHGQATWKLASPTRIDRTFTRVADGKPQPVGSDYCTKH